MVGERLGTYRILEPLGAGGMGEVYLAEDTRLGRKVALKVLPAAFAADSERVTRLEQEARLLAALNHTNVATLFGLEEHEGSLFLIMEFVDGESLADRIARGPLPVTDAVAVAEQIASALEAAHASHIVHRDLKPANVMMTRDGQVKVLDFGIATAVAPRAGAGTADTPTVAALTAADGVIGTVAYMSPEQARGEPATPATDVWGVGAILHEMLSGSPPFGGDSVLSTLHAVQHGTPTAIGQIRNVAPGPVSAIVEKALAKQPADRQTSMSVLRAELTAAREGLAAPPDQESASTLRFLRRPSLIAAAIALVAVAGWFVVSQMRLRAEQRWAREEAIPEITRIAEAFLSGGPSDEAWRAVELARRAEAAMPGDPTLQELWEQIAIESETDGFADGVSLFARPYAAADVDWTPVEVLASGNLRLPRGLSRLRVVFPGREPMEMLTGGGISPQMIAFYADRPAPAGMVPVPGRQDDAGALVRLTGLGEPRQAFEDFFLDRYEVTNREYKEFVDAGGYADPAYWKEPVMQDGREIAVEAARALFVDTTGRPGPSTWQLGDYPEGQDDYPVSGLSWYEAAAYARFRGKSLPSIFHWDRAAAVQTALAVIPASNLRSDGPVSVGSIDAMNSYGTYDMAGNVREWVWNREASGSDRFILGGAWSDPDYAFTDAFAQSPLDRSPLNGVRLMQYIGEEPRLAGIETALARPHRDFKVEAPVDDATFELYLRQFDYDPASLDAVVARTAEGDGWRWERVEFNAAYGGERMAAYIVVPSDAAPPFQAVIHFPGSGALYSASPEQELATSRWTFFVKTGRAYVLPVFKSTYDRQDHVKSDYPDETVEYREHLIMWFQDFSRTIDYLETRDDIDAERVAYFGTSWGGAFGSQIPAVEPRIKAVILVVAGMNFQMALPEVDHINYIGRVTQPVLMINGQYDYFFPVESAQRPMYELLGTPEEHKRWQVYPGTHNAPMTEIVKESLAWLDRYLGPVR